MKNNMNAMTDEMLEQISGGEGEYVEYDDDEYRVSNFDFGDALGALFFFQIPGLVYYMCTRN